MIQAIGPNDQIKAHVQLTPAQEWEHADHARIAYEWFDALNQAFFDGMLPQVVIGFDESGRLHKAGAYHYSADGLGLRHHIDLQKGLDPLETVIALLHNMVHEETETYADKMTWFHTSSFRARMAQFGIRVNDKGDTIAVVVKTFKKVLSVIDRQNLLEVIEQWEPMTEPEIQALPPVPEPKPKRIGKGPKAGTYGIVKAEVTKKPTKGKMRKWTCGCTIVRCAVELVATCGKCQQAFQES